MSEFVLPVRVYYEDTDSGGVVYYANYLKFMERARTEYLRDHGFEQDEVLAEHGVLFAVRSVQVDYRRPARFNDLLDVSAAIETCRGARIDFVQQVRRRGEVLCEGTVRVVSIDGERFRPRPVPRTILRALRTSVEGVE